MFKAYIRASRLTLRHQTNFWAWNGMYGRDPKFCSWKLLPLLSPTIVFYQKNYQKKAEGFQLYSSPFYPRAPCGGWIWKHIKRKGFLSLSLIAHFQQNLLYSSNDTDCPKFRLCIGRTWPKSLNLIPWTLGRLSGFKICIKLLKSCNNCCFDKDVYVLKM